MNQEHYKVVIQTLKGPCGVTDEIVPGSRLLEDLKLDSMGMLCLAVDLENQFRVKLGEDPESPPKTVEEVTELLSLRLKASGNA